MKYSKRETELLKYLKRKRGGLTVTDMVDVVYDNTNMPMYPRETLRITLDRLAAKIEEAKDGYKLIKDKPIRGETLYILEKQT